MTGEHPPPDLCLPIIKLNPSLIIELTVLCFQPSNVVSMCYIQNLTVCQLTGHAEYLVPYSTCPLIHGGSMEKIKEQSSNIEGESPEELTPDKQQLGPAPRPALPQRAGLAPGHSSSANRALPPGCSSSASRAPTPWLLALSE